MKQNMLRNTFSKLNHAKNQSLDTFGLFGQCQTKFLSHALFNIFIVVRDACAQHVHSLLIYNHMYNGYMGSTNYNT